MTIEREVHSPLLGTQQQQNTYGAANGNSAESSDSEITIIATTTTQKPPNDLLIGTNIVFVLMGYIDIHLYHRGTFS
jgi:hypothetical protein